VALYLVLALRGLKVAYEAPDLFGRGLASGIVFWISTQALLNIMSFINLIPLTGVPLPFVSFGSTSLLINLAAMGILVNISSYSKYSNHSSNSKTMLKSNIHRPKFTIM
jgi:cell division protein FtsW